MKIQRKTREIAQKLWIQKRRKLIEVKVGEDSLAYAGQKMWRCKTRADGIPVPIRQIEKYHWKMRKSKKPYGGNSMRNERAPYVFFSALSPCNTIPLTVWKQEEAHCGHAPRAYTNMKKRSRKAEKNAERNRKIERKDEMHAAKLTETRGPCYAKGGKDHHNPHNTEWIFELEIQK